MTKRGTHLVKTERFPQIAHAALKWAVATLLLGSLLFASKRVIEACPPLSCILNVTKNGSGCVRLQPPAQFFITSSSGAKSYAAGTLVTLTASPADNFVRWEGAITSTNSSVTTTMNGNKAVTAIFNQRDYPIVTSIHRLSVINPTCGSTCFYAVYFSENVTGVDSSDFSFSYTGTVSGASVESVFEWDTPDKYIVTVRTGAGHGTLRLELDDNNSIKDAQQNPLGGSGEQDYTAGETFDIDRNVLTLATQGGGTVSASPYECTGNVTLTAIPDDGWAFDRWEGAVTGSDNPIEVTMDTDRAVTAFFIRQFTLTTNCVPEGLGNLHILLDPTGGVYDPGTQGIEVTATCSGSYRFHHWEGDLQGDTNPQYIDMDRDKTITAVFIEQYYVLSYINGSGTVARSPAGPVYDPGTEVTLTASASEGWKLHQWSQALPPNYVYQDLTDQNPITVAVNSTMKMKATFVERIVFPDPNLDAAVRQVINKPSGDIWPEDVENLTQFNASGLSIHDLTGLNRCTALTSLNISNNPITSIAPIQTLTGLTVLNASSCSSVLDWMPLRSLVNLQELYLANNNLHWDGTEVLAQFHELHILNLSHNSIYLITTLVDFWTLRHLDLSYNLCYYNTSFPWMPNLEDLNLSHCNMTTLGLVQNLTFSYLNLDYNGVVRISPLLLNPNMDPGVTVSLLNNPLGDAASCKHIDELEAMGVVVLADQEDRVCNLSPDPSTDFTDADGDGRTNSSEWEYLTLYYGNYEECWELYFSEYVFDNTIYPPADIQCIPKVVFHFAVEGEGTVDLLPQGQDQMMFARYPIDCPDPCAQNPPCEINKVRLAAVPGPGYLFKKWSGDIFEEYDNPVETATISDKQIVAEFVYRPEVAGLDLLAALSALLNEFGYPADAYLTIDRNGITPINGVHYFTGNGIPDAAEFLLLQTLLTQPNIDFGGTTGLIGDLLYEAWVQNIERTAVDMYQVPLPIRQACAAYMTLGDYQTVQSLNDLMSCAMYGDLLYGLVFNDELYDTSEQQYFLASRDADADGFSNLREWGEAVDSLGESGGNNAATFNAYSAMGTDGDRAGQPNEPDAPSMPACGTCQTGTIRIQRQFVSIPAYGEELGEVQALGPNGEIPLDQDVSLPAGTEVKLIAKPYDGVEFQLWACSYGSTDVFPSGSRDTNITVTIRPYVATLGVVAYFGTRYLWLVPSDCWWLVPPVSEKIRGEFDSAFYEMPEWWYQGGCRNDGCRAFRAPLHTRYTVSCSSDVCWDQYEYSDASGISGTVCGQDIFTPCCSGGYPCEDPWTFRVTSIGEGAAYYSVTIYPEGQGVRWYHFTKFTTCDYLYQYGHYIAVPAPGWEFDHWSGEETYPPSPRTAVFRKKIEWQLTTNTAIDDGGTGAYSNCLGGYVRVDPPKAYCSPGEQVTITAWPLDGFQFSEWIGDVSNPTVNPSAFTMDSNKSVTAVFIPASIPAVTQVNFTSDYHFMSDETETFAGEGTPYTAPTWDPSIGHNNPICQTRNTPLTAIVSVTLPPCVGTFTLEGAFSGTIVLAGTGDGSGLTETTVNVQSNVNLPNKFDHYLDKAIDWTVTDEHCTVFNMGVSGPHEIFVTWGPPAMTPTYKRLKTFIDLVSGLGEDAVSLIAKMVATHVNENTEFGKPTAGNVWLCLDDSSSYKVDCGEGALLACDYILGVLGWYGTDRHIFSAYASTDAGLPGKYLSDCSDQETRDGANLHFRYYRPADDGGWMRTENGFKICDAAGVWFYVTTHCYVLGPFSSTEPYPINMKQCLYGVMSGQVQKYPEYDQYWGVWPNYQEADNLPPYAEQEW